MKKIDWIAYTIHNNSKCLVFVRGFDYHVVCSPTLKQITRLTLALEKQHGYLVGKDVLAIFQDSIYDDIYTWIDIGAVTTLRKSPGDYFILVPRWGGWTWYREQPQYFPSWEAGWNDPTETPPPDIGSDTWVKIVAWRPIPEIPEEFMKKD